ncbi:hypothetical protein MHYP_G00177380 [Metynnis hypsauchen]
MIRCLVGCTVEQVTLATTHIMGKLRTGPKILQPLVVNLETHNNGTAMADGFTRHICAPRQARQRVIVCMNRALKVCSVLQGGGTSLQAHLILIDQLTETERVHGPGFLTEQE